jgi:hypothetical protein
VATHKLLALGPTHPYAAEEIDFIHRDNVHMKAIRIMATAVLIAAGRRS